MSKFAVGLTGSREVTLEKLWKRTGKGLWSLEADIHNQLNMVFGRIKFPADMIIVDGDCPKGFDSLISEQKFRMYGRKRETIPFSAGGNHRGGGLVRNGMICDRLLELELQGYKIMVMGYPMEDRPEDLALPPRKREHSKGTYHCMGEALARRIPVVTRRVEW